jgi:hypothetical protein
LLATTATSDTGLDEAFGGSSGVLQGKVCGRLLRAAPVAFASVLIGVRFVCGQSGSKAIEVVFVKVTAGCRSKSRHDCIYSRSGQYRASIGKLVQGVCAADG